MQEESVQPQNAQNQGDKPLEEQLAEAQAKVQQQREEMMRALAETDNVRKRLKAESATAQKFALERFAESLLPVLDSLEAAVAAGSSAPEPVRNGVELTLRQLLAVLEKAHIREINPAPGERFDPHRHQAMAAIEAKGEPNTIVSSMQKGYSLHDRILRPALVTVAKPVENDSRIPISDTDLD